MLRRVTALAALAAATLVASPVSATAADCFSQSVKEKLDGAEIAFIGRVKSVRPVVEHTGVQRFDYGFLVDRAVKGELAKRVTVRAARLVDIDNQQVTPKINVAIGVLASRVDDRLVTSTCSLVDPGALMGATDEPKGGTIKVVIGMIILAIVIAYSWRRLKRRQADQLRPR